MLAHIFTNCDVVQVKFLYNGCSDAELGGRCGGTAEMAIAPGPTTSWFEVHVSVQFTIKKKASYAGYQGILGYKEEREKKQELCQCQKNR